MNQKVFEELTLVLNEAEKDPEVSVVILTCGAELFGAGAEIQMLSGLKSSAACYLFTGENRAYSVLENLGNRL